MKFKSPTTAKQIATDYNCELVGDEHKQVLGLNEIHNVEEGDITFVDHEKYYKSTLQSKASVILINQRIAAPEGKTLLYCEHPYEVYDRLAKLHRPTLQSSEHIASDALIGEGTFIFPSAFVGKAVTIGKNCVIHPAAVIYPYTEIGDNVIIHANTTIGADAFYYKRTSEGYKKMHNAGNVVIKNNVEIGAGCTIDAGVSSETTIGEGTKIDDQVHIGHDVKIGQHCIIAGQVGIAGNTIVGNHVTLYGKVAVNKNITIGDNVTVYACSAIAKSLEPNKTYLGVPAEEARAMAKQFAMLRKLPDMWELFKKLNH